MAKYRSKFEARVAKSLTERGMDFTYEPKTYPYSVPLPPRSARCMVCGGRAETTQKYTPDFQLANGIVVETKGYFKAEHRKTYKAFVEQHPDVDFRIVFMANGKMHRKGDNRYGDWCDNNGFTWAVGDIPDSWLTE